VTLDQKKNEYRQSETSGLERLLILRLGALRLAVYSEQILTTCDWIVPTQLPFSPEPVKGIISIDGRMFTVLEIGKLFGEDSAAERKLIVAFRGDEQLALTVDSLETELEVNASDIASVPQHEPRTVRGVLHLNGDQIQVLDVNELFSSAIQGRARRRRRF
jgi:chemotaxis signal transduction protein